MKKYIRCHVVEAEPMTRYAFDNLKNREHTSPTNDDGYHVVYPDGYESWCPKAQFEAAGNPIENMTFGQAIDACRYRGVKIQRANWNGEGQFVRFEYITAYEDGGRAYPDERTIGSDCFVFHFVNRKTGETGIQVGWLASQADMAACDWRIVE